jgi:hypothetical protein
LGFGAYGQALIQQAEINNKLKSLEEKLDLLITKDGLSLVVGLVIIDCWCCLVVVAVCGIFAERLPESNNESEGHG